MPNKSYRNRVSSALVSSAVLMCEVTGSSIPRRKNKLTSSAMVGLLSSRYGHGFHSPPGTYYFFSFYPK
jgi:hypothetical protein